MRRHAPEEHLEEGDLFAYARRAAKPVPAPPPTESPIAFFADGETFDVDLDSARLGAQAGRVHDLMADGQWRTLREISEATGGDPESSVSARLRDLRKRRFGHHLVERRRRGDPSDGLFEYRMETPKA